MVHIDEEALRSSLQRLRQAAFDADVVAVLKRTVNAVDDVFGYSGAGIMFITESGQLAYVAASDESGRQLEEAQAAAGQGPCYDSYVYAREIVSSDLRTDDRWPDLRLPDQWDDSDVQALRGYSGLIAEILATALAAADRGAVAEQLQYALDYRVVIERAVGYLMGAHGLTATTAFNLLRKQARDSRRRVADVAAEVLGGSTGPDAEQIRDLRSPGRTLTQAT